MNAATILPSIETLRECFDYNPETGELRWKIRPRSHFLGDQGYGNWHRRFPGKLAGYNDTQRSTKRPTSFKIRLTILNECYNTSAHRVVLAMNGIDVPKGMVIDHIDGNPLNNRLSNLRVCTHGQNIANNRGYRNGDHTPRSLPKGVYRNGKRYNSYITINGVKHYVGRFKTPEEASEAFNKKFQELRPRLVP